MKKIITIGGATHDIFIHHESVDFECLSCSKIEVSGLHRATGGGATNSAVSCKHLGFDVYSFFKVGNDDSGRSIIKSLKDQGIDTHYVITTDAAPTAVSFVIHKKEECVIFAYRGANMTITEEELPLAAFFDVDCVYVTSLSGHSASLLPRICSAVATAGLPLAVNPGSSQFEFGGQEVLQSLQSITVFILNKHEAERLWNICACVDRAIPFSIKEYCSLILARGPKIVVVTDGPRGVYVASHDGVYFHPSLAKKVINTVGAGDAFGSTFFACLQLGMTLQESMMCGLVNSASVLAAQDAKSGLLYFDDLVRKAHEVGFLGIQKLI